MRWHPLYILAVLIQDFIEWRTRKPSQTLASKARVAFLASPPNTEE